MQTINPSLDTWTILFALAAAQGFFLCLLLWYSTKGNRSANRILALFIFFFAFTLTEYVLHWTRYIIHFPIVANWYMPLVFVFGPLLLYYFMALNKDLKWDWKIGLHLIPALLFLINKLPFYFSSLAAKSAFMSGDQSAGISIQWYVIDIRHIQDYLFIIHLSLYAILLYRYLKKEQFWQVSGNDDKSMIRKRWSKVLLGLYLGFVISNISYYLLIRTPYFAIEYDYAISFTMSAFIYIAGFLGLRQTEIFAGELWPDAFMAPKYQSSALTPSASRSMLDRIIDFVEQEKPYLDNELRLSTLAEQLDISSHHLSQVINEQMDTSFSDFINKYRIEEAKQMLCDPKFDDQYIINIAYSAGFNNKTSFNKAFKNHTGISPSVFRQTYRSGNKKMTAP